MTGRVRDTGLVLPRHKRDRVVIKGRVVAEGSLEAMHAAMILLLGEVVFACESPSGRFDGHGTYVCSDPEVGISLCAFCMEQ